MCYWSWARYVRGDPHSGSQVSSAAAKALRHPSCDLSADCKLSPPDAIGSRLGQPMAAVLT